MDPLSITTGVLTVLSAGGQLFKQLNKLVALKDAPDDLRLLNDEVCDLVCILLDVEGLLEPLSDGDVIHVPMAVTKALQRSKATALEVEKFIAYDLTVIARDKRPRVDKSRWLCKTKQMQTYRMRLRCDTTRLSEASAILVASLSTSLSRNVQRLTLSINTLASSKHDWNTESYKQPLSLAPISVQERLTNETSSSYCSSSVAPATGETPDDSHADIGVTRRLCTNSSVALSEAAACSCGFGCGCIYHDRTQTRSTFWKEFLMQLPFAGSTLSPTFGQTSSSSTYQNPTAGLALYTYKFSPWFSDRIIKALLLWQASKGPELLIRVMRVRSSDTPIFQISCSAPFHDNNSMMKAAEAQFHDGRASVYDITTSGLTALHLAVLFHDWALAELLVSMGSDIFYVDAYGRSPYSIAWRIILGTDETTENIQLLQRLFSSSQSDGLRLPRLHRALMGLSGQTFHATLGLVERSAVDAVDASQRTALSWAAQRGDKHALARLLTCGADPNVPDLSGKTPLHWAALSGKPQCTQNLILAKADIEARDNAGRTALSHAATGPGNEDTVGIFLAVGADTTRLDDSSWSPLDWAAWFDASESLQHLLDHNARLGIESSQHNQIFWAMQHNCYNALKVLLVHPGSIINTDLYGYRILDYGAQFANTKTLETLLTHKNVMKLDLSPNDAILLLSYAKWRRDHNRSWSEAQATVPDEDTCAWYEVFEAIVNLGRSAKDVDRLSSVDHPTSDETDDEDSEDIWQESQERLKQ